MNDIKLGVNIDHVATLRQSRLTRYPDPVDAALAVERAGADSLTIHLREDRRHIQDRDIRILGEVINIPMNLEMAVTDEMIAIACDTRPQYSCLVPERREELTTEGGLDVAGQSDRITGAVRTLQDSGIRVSLFIDADKRQIDAAAETGADMIEIHTGQYADKAGTREREAELERVLAAVTHAGHHDMQINAGHGLNYHNVIPIAAIAAIAELNIGHAIIARAVFTGLEHAVREMLGLMRSAR